jgi:hypothetical protein
VLDELNLVAIRIDDECNHRRAVLHRPGFATDEASLGFDLGAGGVGVVDFYRDVAKALAELVAVGIPVVGQLDCRSLGLRAEPDEGQGEATLGVFAAAEKLHAEHVRIEGQRTFQVADAKHCVKNPHGPAETTSPAGLVKAH